MHKIELMHIAALSTMGRNHKMSSETMIESYTALLVPYWLQRLVNRQTGLQQHCGFDNVQEPIRDRANTKAAGSTQLRQL